MKKVLGIILAGALLLQGVPVYAADSVASEQNNLSFAQLKEKVHEQNVIIQENLDTINNGVNSAEDIQDLLILQETMYDARIDAIITTYNYTKLRYTQLTAEQQAVVDGYIGSMGYTGSTDSVRVLYNASGALIAIATSKDSADNDIWITFMPQQDLELDVVDNKVDISQVVDALNLSLIGQYEAQIFALETQIASIESQLDSAYKSEVQIEQVNAKIVWGAQQLFLTCVGLEDKLKTLAMQRDLLQKQVLIGALQVQLGLSTNLQYQTTEAQLRDLSFSIKQLEQSIIDLKGSLNVMLGETYDQSLTLEEITAPDNAAIQSLNYDADLQTAVDESLDVQLAGGNGNLVENQERTITSAFNQAYQSVMLKREALSLEQLKLDSEKERFTQSELMYNLGMISGIAYDAAKATYQSQEEKVNSAESDLLKVYTQYQWLLEGVNVISGS